AGADDLNDSLALAAERGILIQTIGELSLFGFARSSFFEAISSHAKASPAKAAVVAAESLSYRALEDRVIDAHRWLSAAGLEPSSIAGISIADEVEHLVATLGLLRL